VEFQCFDAQNIFLPRHFFALEFLVRKGNNLLIPIRPREYYIAILLRRKRGTNKLLQYLRIKNQ
jgi:hypothetical protein